MKAAYPNAEVLALEANPRGHWRQFNQMGHELRG
jgi:hypothetical protein